MSGGTISFAEIIVGAESSVPLTNRDDGLLHIVELVMMIDESSRERANRVCIAIFVDL